MIPAMNLCMYTVSWSYQHTPVLYLLLACSTVSNFVLFCKKSCRCATDDVAFAVGRSFAPFWRVRDEKHRLHSRGIAIEKLLRSALEGIKDFDMLEMF
jgi:hypothetical protein